jgi:hypothetical protein
MVDMRRHLRRWLNDTELIRRGGRYEGIIENVLEETVRNRFTAQREQVPVIVFADGWRIIPNLSMRTELIEIFGPQSDEWLGRRLTIFRRRIEQRDRTTGEIRERFQKAIYVPDRHAREPLGDCINDFNPAAITADEIFDHE